MVKSSLSSIRYAFLVLTAFMTGSYVGFYWRDKISLPSTSVVVNIEKRRVEEPKDIENNERSPGFTRPSPDSSSSCVPQPNLMFLKTHKTASSAVQNVLLRFADKHSLTVGLSNNNDIRFRYGNAFRSTFVAHTVKPVNIICHHMIFNYNELQKVMQRNATYITILREPGSLFESIFDYMHYDSKPFSRLKKQPNALEFWLNHTDILFRGKNDGALWWFAKNGVFYDMGYDNLQESDEYIQKAIQELDKQFHLVLIADYFDESMLLLRDQMCWSMRDVLALKTNARSETKTVLTDKLVKRIREWNKADAAVYDYFNKTFWKKVEAYGTERMRVDLKLLEEMNAEIHDACIEGEAVSNKFIKNKLNKVYNPRGVTMTGYNLKESAKNNRTCVNLLKGEIQWTRELMMKNKLAHQKTVKV